MRNTPAPPEPLFGTSGVRGPFGTRVTPELAMRLGRAAGRMRRRLLVGRDARLSSPALASAVAAGALDAGAEVADAGLVCTPTLAWAARRFDAGVMVTASHNPPEDNGLKFFNPDGTSFAPDEEERLVALASDETGTDWAGAGRLEPLPGLPEAHLEALRSRCEGLDGLTVVVDSGCGAVGGLTARLLAGLGARVVSLNAQPDGTFPARPSEPSAENLAALAAAVRSEGADLGLAHDGDGDRVTVLDETGAWVEPPRLLALLARFLGAKRAVVPVDASGVVEAVLGAGNVLRSRVGDVFVANLMKREKVPIGGEPSGTWFFADWSLAPDSLLAAARISRLVATQGPLSQLNASLPSFHVERKKLALVGDRGRVMQRLAAGLAAAQEKVDTVDGLRVATAEGWFLVRPSGTEPILRLTAEAASERDAKRLLSRAEKHLAAALADAPEVRP